MAKHASLGLDVVFQPTTAEIDIVFVHGLAGHFRHTWECQGKNWTSDADFLPHLLKTARIMSFGYNANVFSDVAECKIADHAGALLSGLLVKRTLDDTRPLIFVAHSLGGIVAKKALLSAKVISAYNQILESTKGIVFLGTPHWGTDLATWLAYAQRLAAWARLRNDAGELALELRPFSDTLRSISSEFPHVASEYRIRIRSFRETKATRVGLVPRLIVEQGSALMGHQNELGIALYETHESICKFSTPQDSSYKEIAGHISMLVENALDEAERDQISQTVLEERLRSMAPVPKTEPCKKFFEVDLPRNVNFRGRTKELQAIENYLSPGALNRVASRRAVVLSGMGGIGKSQLALEYAFAHRHNYAAIFWISCKSEDTLKDSLSNAGKAIGDQALREWLQTNDSKQWLLIFDNLDMPCKDFIGWVPPTGGGSFIYTTRRSTLGNLGKIIKINPLNTDTATELLLQVSQGRTETPEDYEAAKRLVKSLGGLPLAIQQCGSYISASQQALSAYPAQLDALMEKLELYGSNQEFDFNEQNKPILETWDLSYNNLVEENEGAADLLCIMSFLDGTDIYEEILRRGFISHKYWDNQGNVGTIEMTDILKYSPRSAHRSNVQRFDLALQRLLSYSLVFRKRDATKLYMHPVVWYWARHRLGTEKQQWYIKTLRFITVSYPHPDLSDTYGQNLKAAILRRRYKPHLVRLMSTMNAYGEISSTDLPDMIVFLIRTQPAKECATIIETSLRRIPDRMDIWFLAFRHQFEYLCDVYVPSYTAHDILQPLSVLRLGGKTWSQQVLHLRASKASEIGTSAPPKHSYHKKATKNPNLQVLDSRLNLPLPGEGVPANGMPSFHPIAKVRNDHLFSPATLEVDNSVIIELVMPLPSGKSQGLERFISGTIGQTVITIFERWNDSFGRITTTTLKDGSELTVLDARRGSYILKRWIQRCNDASDLERFCKGVMLSQLARIEQNTVLSIQMLEKAVATIKPILGFENHLCHCLINDLGWKLLMSHRHKELETIILNLADSEAGINYQNFYALVKSIDILQSSFCLRGDLEKAEELLKAFLAEFQSVPAEHRVTWVFSNDPILDILELLVLFYREQKKDDVLTQDGLAKYQDYFDKTYKNPYQRMCLGLGVGRFGMSRSRLRMELEPRKIDDGYQSDSVK